MQGLLHLARLGLFALPPPLHGLEDGNAPGCCSHLTPFLLLHTGWRKFRVAAAACMATAYLLVQP